MGSLLALTTVAPLGPLRKLRTGLTAVIGNGLSWWEPLRRAKASTDSVSRISTVLRSCAPGSKPYFLRAISTITSSATRVVTVKTLFDERHHRFDDRHVRCSPRPLLPTSGEEAYGQAKHNQTGTDRYRSSKVFVKRAHIGELDGIPQQFRRLAAAKEGEWKRA